MSSTSKSTPRYRKWALLVYPDSAPANWKDIISEYGAPWACILHDKDIQWIEQEGRAPEPKLSQDGKPIPVKPHYHVIIYFSNQKSYTQMLSLTGKLRAPYPQSKDSLVASARHLLHRNSGDMHKHQYEPDEILEFNGMDVSELIKPSKKETAEILKEIRWFIRAYDIREFYELSDFSDDEKPLWSEVIARNAYLLNQYINSRRYGTKRRIKEAIPILEEPYRITATLSYLQSPEFKAHQAFVLREREELGLDDFDEDFY